MILIHVRVATVVVNGVFLLKREEPWEKWGDGKGIKEKGGCMK